MLQSDRTGAFIERLTRLMLLTRSSVLAAIVPVLLACSANTRGEPAAGGASGAGSGGQNSTPIGDDRAFFPEGLPNPPVSGEVADGLTVLAFTLRQRAGRLAFYAAVRNDRETPACEGGMTTNFLDHSGQIVTSATSVLESAHFYRLDTSVVIRCVAPGEIAMTGVAELPADVVLSELGSLQHAFPAFTVDHIVPVEALTVSDVRTVTTGVGTSYAGTLRNQLSVGASSPRVTIFPLNRVGRPLSMAMADAGSELPASSSWSFETSNVDAEGVDFAAYPSATFER